MGRPVSMVRDLVIIIGVLLAPLCSAAEARTVFRNDGSPGDAREELECPRNFYLAGFSGAAGSWIDRIQLVCAAYNGNGVFDPALPVNNPRGGGGGVAVRNDCTAGTVIKKISPYYNADNKQLVKILATCQNVNGANGLVFVFGGTGTTNKVTEDNAAVAVHECPPGEYATGFNLSFGRHVNGLALICDALVQRPAPPKPIKSSGKARPSGPSVAPVEAFQGGWQTVTDQNGHYTLILQLTNPGVSLVASDLYVTGQFINTDGANQYNGTLQGTIPRGTRTLHYNYAQPGISAGGQGEFTLSNDGNAITGTGTAGSQTFTWNGTRAK